MHRNVELVGEIGDLFGTTHKVYAKTYSDALKCIEANHPELRKYLIDCVDRGVSFSFYTEESEAETGEDLLVPLTPGDITIAAVPEGSKSAFAKILAAVILFTVIGPYMASLANANTVAGSVHGLGGSVQAGKFLGMTAKTITTMYTTVATNLAIMGIQQLMAPDPDSDASSPTNYLFNGNAQSIAEGDPIPLLYGELRVPGHPISINQFTKSQLQFKSHTMDSNNNISVVWTSDPKSVDVSTT